MMISMIVIATSACSVQSKQLLDQLNKTLTTIAVLKKSLN